MGMFTPYNIRQRNQQVSQLPAGMMTQPTQIASFGNSQPQMYGLGGQQTVGMYRPELQSAPGYTAPAPVQKQQMPQEMRGQMHQAIRAGMPMPPQMSPQMQAVWQHHADNWNKRKAAWQASQQAQAAQATPAPTPAYPMPGQPGFDPFNYQGRLSNIQAQGPGKAAALAMMLRQNNPGLFS